MIKCKDSLEFLKEIQDLDLNIIYADPPYALGSDVIIRKDGKVDYAKASDFMSKWEMPTGEYWEKWFQEAFRTLKYGGYCVMFGMDRQLLLFKYYAHLAGFEEHQSLYWYFISNFPKATDLSKLLDHRMGEVREKIKVEGNKTNTALHITSGEKEVDEPISDLATKYNGYKYSVAPLKQTNETIMVFKKPSKTGSVINDTLAFENGDTTISVSALNIEESRVATSDKHDIRHYQGEDCFQNTEPKKTQFLIKERSEGGRYPAQTFIDSGVSKVLNRQSGDPGECSKILNKCDYDSEDYDIYLYEPKVSKRERDAGLDEFEPKQYSHDGREKQVENAFQRNESRAKNSHPTLKPISLNERVLKLFKTPNPQKICYPFAGSGSEIIGGIKAGFENWIACEINQEYVDIANARIEYWKTQSSVQTTIFDFL